MLSQSWSAYVVVFVSFMLAFLLSVYPLPVALRWWRPEFVLLLAIYWISVFPITMSLVFLCVVGLFQDLLEGVPLGQHALAILIIAYVCILSYQRVRNYALWKEAGWVFVLVSLAQLPGNWVQSMAGRPLAGFWFLAPALSSAVIWPLMRIAMERIGRHYRITP